MRRTVVSLAFMAALLGAGLARAEIKAGDHEADFSAATLGGQQLKLSSLRGKVVLLDFWASWCEPCKKELPLLAKMAPRLRSKGIEIVAVNIDDDKAKAADFLKTHGLAQLTVVPDNGINISADDNRALAAQLVGNVLASFALACSPE